MSTNTRPVQTSRIRLLLGLATVQTLVTVGHFAHGANVYDEPERLHIVGPAIVFLAIAGVLGLVAWRWPRSIARWALAAELTAVNVGLFGVFHGGWNHLAKDLAYVVGASGDWLARTFDSPDFTIPNDGVYELTGLLGLVLGGAIAIQLVKLVRDARRGA